MKKKKTGWTDTEIMAMKFDPEESRAEEQAFRRGYFYGVDDAIEAIRAGVTLDQLIDYYNGELWAWNLGDYTKEVKPPAMPKKKGGLILHNKKLVDPRMIRDFLRDMLPQEED